MIRYSEHSLRISRTSRKKSEPNISGFQCFVSAMDCENSASREKTLGYKQRCGEKRATYCQDLAVKKQMASLLFISMNAVFVRSVLSLMRMPRRVTLFWDSYPVKDPGKPQW